MKPDTDLLSTSITREMLQHHGVSQCQFC